MIIRRPPFLLFLAGLLIAATCERPVDLVEIVPPPQELVLNCSFAPNEFVRVAVTSSQFILDNDLPEYLGNADVRLYEGENFLEQLELFIDSVPRTPPYYTTRTFKPQPSVLYTIKVSATGFEPVTAHSFIPESIPFSQLQILNLVELPPSDPRRRRIAFELMLNFDDPIEEDNFYHLIVDQELHDYFLTENGDTTITNTTLLRLSLMSNNPDIVEDEIEDGGLLFKNNPQPEGFRFQLEREIDPEFQILGHVVTELRTVSKEYYEYYTTFSRQQKQTEGPFRDPIVIADNVMNGQGIFAGYNPTQDSLRIDF